MLSPIGACSISIKPFAFMPMQICINASDYFLERLHTSFSPNIKTQRKHNAPGGMTLNFFQLFLKR